MRESEFAMAQVVVVESLPEAVNALVGKLVELWPTPEHAPPDIAEALVRLHRAVSNANVLSATHQLWLLGAERPPGDVAISLERRHQIADRGFTLQHDRSHDAGELLEAVLYLLTGGPSSKAHWPWPESKTHVDDDYDEDRRLAVAGALIAAEYDRLAGT